MDSLGGVLCSLGRIRRNIGALSNSNRSNNHLNVDEDVSSLSPSEPTNMASSPEAAVHTVTALLAKKLPVELIPDILDYAEYFAHERLAACYDKGRVQSTQGKTVTDVYVTAKIPDFAAWGEGTAGKGGREGAGGRPNRVRKLVFNFRSRDQGWSSHPEYHGGYEWCSSWIDVEVWRKRETGSSAEGEDAGDESGMYKVQECLLQKNKHADAESLEYEVSWRWDEDKLPNDEANVSKIGRHENNGGFVRELKGGDEIRVVLKVHNVWWECRISHCEIDCWWAV